LFECAEKPYMYWVATCSLLHGTKRKSNKRKNYSCTYRDWFKLCSSSYYIWWFFL